MTVKLLTLSGRSSSGKFAISTGLLTTEAVGTVTVGATPATGADSSTVVVVGSSATRIVLVPSSVIVAIPPEAFGVPPVLVAVKVNVSPAAFSRVVSSLIATRTNKLAFSLGLPSPSLGT